MALAIGRSVTYPPYGRSAYIVNALMRAERILRSSRSIRYEYDLASVSNHSETEWLKCSTYQYPIDQEPNCLSNQLSAPADLRQNLHNSPFTILYTVVLGFLLAQSVLEKPFPYSDSALATARRTFSPSHSSSLDLTYCPPRFSDMNPTRSFGLLGLSKRQKWSSNHTSKQGWTHTARSPSWHIPPPSSPHPRPNRSDRGPSPIRPCLHSLYRFRDRPCASGPSSVCAPVLSSRHRRTL